MEVEYCMKRHCKTCRRNTECDLLQKTLYNRLMYKPFENLKQIMEAKNGNKPR